MRHLVGSWKKAEQEAARRHLLDFILYTKPDYETNWHHKVICDYYERWAFGDIDRLMLFMPPQNGKCLPGGTLITMANGQLKPIETVCPSEKVISFDGHSLTMEKVVATSENGVKKLLKIQVQSGRTISCTPNHKFLTVNGWMEASKLNVGNSLAFPRKTPMTNGEALPIGLASIMGYIIGDGSFGHGNPIITAHNEAIVEHLREIAEKHDWVVRSMQSHAYYISGKVRNSCLKTSCNTVLSNYMNPAVSANKRVPDCIMSGNAADIADFLGAYFNCDGSVNLLNSCVAEYYSISKDLLADVQILLTRFGIYSALRPKMGKYKGKDHHSWRLIIAGQDLISFAEKIPIRGVKGVRLSEASEINSTKRHTAEYDAIPVGWKEYLKRSVSWYRLREGIRVDKIYKYGTARYVVQKIADLEQNKRLSDLCSPDIIWERIIKIDPGGSSETYDLEISSSHVFVANGFITHNTEIVSRRGPAWVLGKNPDAKFVSCSYAADYASGINRDVQRIISSPEYKELFPSTSLNDKNIRTAAQGDYVRNSDLFEIVGHVGRYFCAGRGGGISGNPMTHGNIDDILKGRQEADSPAIMKEFRGWFSGEFFSRQGKNAKLLITATRWNEDDAPGYLLKLAAEVPDAPQWTVVSFPAIAVEPIAPYDPRQPGEALWSERYPLSHLKQVRALSEYDWQALYQQNPYNDAYAIFNTDKISKVNPGDWQEKVNEGKLKLYGGLDLSKGGNDYAALVTMAVLPDGRWLVWECDLSVDVQSKSITKLIEAQSQYNYQSVWIEANSLEIAKSAWDKGQRSNFEILLRQQQQAAGVAVPYILVWHNKPKPDRIRSLEGHFGNGQLCFREDWAKVYRELINQFRIFPDKNAHDDGCDACEMLVAGLQNIKKKYCMTSSKPVIGGSIF